MGDLGLGKGFFDFADYVGHFLLQHFVEDLGQVL